MESNASSAGDRAPGGKHRRRWVIALAVGASIVAVLLLAATAAIYTERRLIAASFVKQYLTAYGVDSEIEFDRMAWGGFLARVRAGSVEAPDFTADGVDVTLIYPDTSSYVGSVTPQVAAVRLIRPLVRVTYDGEKLSFGSLQRLVDDILAMESDVPGPEIVIDDGRLLLTTPYGTVGVVADATIEKSMLTRFEATIAPTTLRSETFTANMTGGALSAAMDGGALNAKASLSLASLSHAGRTARAVDVSADGSGVRWEVGAAGAFKFTANQVALDVGTAAANSPEFSAGRTSVRVALQGIEGLRLGQQLRLRGHGEISGEVGEVRAVGAEATVLKAQASLSAFNVDVSSGEWSTDVSAKVILDGNDVRYPVAGGAVSLASLHTELGSTVRQSPTYSSTTAKGTLTANGALPGQIALRSLRADFDGETLNGAHHLTLNAVTASTAMPRARALALARDIPTIGSDDALTTSLATSFQNSTASLRNIAIVMLGDAVALTARAPVVIEGAQKANLTVSPRGATPLIRTAGAQTTGGFNLDVSGGGLPKLRVAVASYRHRVEQNRTMLDADAEFETALSYGSFRGIDLSGSGKLAMAGERVRFDVTQCADLTLAAYAAAGEDLVRNLKGRFCGTVIEMTGDRLQLNLANCADVNFEAFRSGGADQARDARGQLCSVPNRPMFVSQPSGWQLEAGLSNAVARLVAGEALVSDGAGRVQLAGDASAIRSGTITLDRANIADLQTTLRFQPISASGAMRVAGDNWTGDFALSLRERRLASVALKHALNTGAGEATIAVRGLGFDPNMLQPDDIAPFLSAFGSRVRGNVDFSGRFSWSKDGMASDGRLVVPGVDLQSPFGAARQLKTELAFTSLVPVALRPAQTVTVERVDLAVPLEQVSARFTYTPEALRLETATAVVAQGRAALDPMTYSFAPGATSRGTLRLQNINAQTLVEAAGLTDRVSVEARIDGAVPFTLGPDGVRFADGRVASNAPGRLSIKREALTASVGTGADAQAPPNAVQDFAYQALEHLAFERLEGVVNSQPMGRLGVLLHLIGQNDPPQVEEARVGIIDLLRGRAFDRRLPLPKGTPIDLTLDTSVNLDELLDSYLNRSSAAAAAPASAAR